MFPPGGWNTGESCAQPGEHRERIARPSPGFEERERRLRCAHGAPPRFADRTNISPETKYLCARARLSSASAARRNAAAAREPDWRQYRRNAAMPRSASRLARPRRQEVHLRVGRPWPPAPRSPRCRPSATAPRRRAGRTSLAMSPGSGPPDTARRRASCPSGTRAGARAPRPALAASRPSRTDAQIASLADRATNSPISSRSFVSRASDFDRRDALHDVGRRPRTSPTAWSPPRNGRAPDGQHAPKHGQCFVRACQDQRVDWARPVDRPQVLDRPPRVLVQMMVAVTRVVRLRPAAYG